MRFFQQMLVMLLCLLPMGVLAEDAKMEPSTVSTVKRITGMPEKAPFKHWVVYYSDKLPADKFTSYDLVVFDADAHPRLQPLLEKSKDLLGYISIGEVEDYRTYYKEVKALDLVLEANKDWKGHYYLDIRKPAFTKYVIEKRIPAVLYQHFNGVMLDTIDSAVDLETKDPKKYKGMKDAAIALVKTIRMHYPDMKIMMNRGIDILPDVAQHIDYLMAESIYISYDAKTKKFSPFPDAVYLEQVKKLKDVKKISPELQIVTLDYWNMKDKKGVQKIYNMQRLNGFIPYVGTLDLQTIYPEP